MVGDHNNGCAAKHPCILHPSRSVDQWSPVHQPQCVSRPLMLQAQPFGKTGGPVLKGRGGWGAGSWWTWWNRAQRTVGETQQPQKPASSVLTEDLVTSYLRLWPKTWRIKSEHTHRERAVPESSNHHYQQGICCHQAPWSPAAPSLHDVHMCRGSGRWGQAGQRVGGIEGDSHWQ